MARMIAFPCILYPRLWVRSDAHSCAVHAVAGMRTRVWLTYMCLCYAARLLLALEPKRPQGEPSLPKHLLVRHFYYPITGDEPVAEQTSDQSVARRTPACTLF